MQSHNHDRILLTGGAGLIGSAICWRLNQLGYQNIVIVDHLGCGVKWQNLRTLNFQDYFEKDQFLPQLEKLPRFNAILHLGACSSTTEEDGSYLADNNFAYSKALAEYAQKYHARMIYASSAATYGDGANGFSDDESLIPKLRPLNKYGYSKQLFDQYLLNNGYFRGGAGHNQGGTFVGVKFSNVFGPNEYHKGTMRSMVLRSFEQIQATGKVQLFQSHRPEYRHGEQVRDFLYVKDAADMTIFFLQGGRHCCGIYNLGYGAVRTWLDLAKAMFTALGKTAEIEFIPMPENLRDKYQYYTCLDITKLRRAGFTQRLLTLEEAVADYARYLPDNAHLGEIAEG